MKKTLLLKSVLLLFALIVGSGTMWADEVTFSTSDFSGQGTSGTGSDITATKSGVTVSCDKGYGTTQIRCYKDANLQISSEKTITAISFTFSGSYTGGLSTSYSDLSTTSWKVTLASQARIMSIAVTYEAGGGSGLEDCDLALTGAPITLNFDLYNSASPQVINYTTSSTGAVTIDDSDYATFSINESGKTITVTPKAVTPSAQTITVNQAADETYEAGSKTFTLTITDSTPIPTHTATFSVNGVTSTQVFEEGAAIVFPDDPADVSGKTFVGWVTEAIVGTTDVAPDFVTSANMGNSDITYYAVFALASGGGSSNVVDELNRALTGVTGTSYSDWTNKTATSSAVYAGNSAGGNDAIQLRSNNSNSGIVTTTSGGKVKKVAITWNSNTAATRTISIYGKSSAYTNASDLYSGNTQGTFLGDLNIDNANNLTSELTISDDVEYIGIRSKSGALYLDEVEITWSTGGGVSYSDYCTTVVAPSVVKPTITVTSPFTFSTEVTMSCETEGATIYYTLDGSDPTAESTEYTAPFNINATTTIKAIAIKDANASSIATVTATKTLATPIVTVSGDLTVDLNGETDVEAGTLTAAVTYNEAPVEGAVVTWSSNNEAVATIGENTGVVTIKTRGTVTFTATYAGNSDYAEATGTKTITVTDSKAPGSEANPYTIAQAKAAIDAGSGVTDVYVAGIVSQVDSYNSKYSSITYWISDDGTTTDQFEVYSGKGIGGADFESIDDIKVGDVVVVNGDITLYNKTTYEFAASSSLVSLVRKVATPTFSPAAGAIAAGTEVTISTSTEGATIYYTTDETEPTTSSTKYTEPIVINAAVTIKAIAVKDGSPDSDVATAAYTIALPCATPTFSPVAGAYTEVQHVEISTLTEGATIYYTTNGTVPTTSSTEYTSAITVDEDMTIKAIAVKDGMANSAVAEAVYEINLPDYATLPFEWDDKSMPTGVTNNGVGTYPGSPYLKFDGTGDYIILKINEIPGELSFDIKGNSFSGGTFKLQASEDGADYTDIDTYTDLGATVTMKYNLASTVRYIKWIYTEKISGNVALGNIKLSKVTNTITLAAACTDGEKYYGTFSTSQAFIVPDDLTVSTVGLNNDGTLKITNYSTGDVVKANTGVLVSAATAGEKTVIISSADGEEHDGNLLKASGEFGVTAGEMAAAASGCLYYRLTMHKGTDIGFWWGAASGAAFDLAGNKAYLAVPEAAAREGFAFNGDGETTGIKAIDNEKLTMDNYYDLSGRKVAEPTKGLYIVNGKKVVIK